ncbi:protein kinase C and casein kinase substrate in neurons protein 2-like isoform X2 [Sitodiplosis mosellana]|uniref:protein kinase C and casein kinase substrate in neurons protein 2-like isoform X2 n=1 Tax=Sitodiplosis mosellana TaxID=263140 RepID=UPI002445329D|nr:protein kinase C and casein kinase substrate in neurons protein 2-like isoform X2 [Sitodiplosis mosellana]
MPQLLRAIDNSFWKPGNYKKTTKRIQKGYALCHGLEGLIDKRAQIEKSYASSLRLWSKKWRNVAESDISYGTTASLPKNIADEGEQIADIHAKTNLTLRCNESKRIRIFRKGFFQKQLLNLKLFQVEERKEMEQLFERAQKPYVKHLKKIEKAKRNYYRACKDAEIVMNQVRYALAEKLIPPQVRRMQVFMEEADYKIYRRRLKYQDALDELMRYHPKYIRNMTSAFLKCQEMEKVELQFYKALLHSLQRTLDLSQNPNLAPIYDELHHVIEQVDYEKDLKMWSTNHAIDTSAPQFIEYAQYEKIQTLEKLDIFVIEQPSTAITSKSESEKTEMESKMETDEGVDVVVDDRERDTRIEKITHVRAIADEMTETQQGTVEPDIISLMSIDDTYEDCTQHDHMMWSVPDQWDSKSILSIENRI